MQEQRLEAGVEQEASLSLNAELRLEAGLTGGWRRDPMVEAHARDYDCSQRLILVAKVDFGLKE